MQIQYLNQIKLEYYKIKKITWQFAFVFPFKARAVSVSFTTLPSVVDFSVSYCYVATIVLRRNFPIEVVDFPHFDVI